MKLKVNKTMLFLGAIVLLSLILRFYNLGNLPWNMQEDEVMTGYVGRFILQNGKDVYGNAWPLLYFNKFGDFYIIGPIYLKGLATYLFGVNAFAVRFFPALFGALTVIPVYAIGSLLFQSSAVGLFSALALAIMPWTIPLGRASSEGILGGFFFLYGIYYLLLGLRKKSVWPIVVGGLFILFTFWIYHNYRLLSSLFVLGFIVYAFFEKKINKKVMVSLIGLMFLFVLLTVAIGRTPWGRGRFDQTGILSPLSGVAIRTQELIFDDAHTPTLITRIFHNKPIGLAREFLHQYFIYFSGDFLFMKGGKSEAYIVPEQGLLYISFLIPLLAVLFFIADSKWMKENRNNLLLLAYFTLISPLPSALTIVDAPNIQRSILLGLFLSLFIGLGIQSLFLHTRKFKIVFIVFFLLMGVEFCYFWHDYTAHTDSFTSIYRNDGQRELIGYLQNEKTAKIYLPTYGTMSMYYTFYTNNFSANLVGKFKNDVRIDSIDNVEFIDKDCPSEDKISFNPSSLVVDLLSCKVDVEKFKEVKTIKGKNELLGFRILTPVQK